MDMKSRVKLFIKIRGENTVKQRVCNTVIVGLAALIFWSSYTSVFAGDTTYETLSNVVQDITQDSYGEFKFRATSPVLPATGRSQQTPYELGCVTAEFLAKDLTFTDPDTAETSDFDFSHWLSIAPASYCYESPSWGFEVTVTVVVPSDAEVGTYGAKLVAKGPAGSGWGEAAGIHILFNVLALTPTDTTPPVITFLDPTERAGFVVGHRVPVDFTAVDHESAVTDWTAVLNPNTAFQTNVASLLSEAAITDGIEAEGLFLTALPVGSETIQAIGHYTLAVTATSEGGTSDPPALRHFDVNYNIDALPTHMAVPTLICYRSGNRCGVTGGDLQIKFRVKAFEPPDTVSTISSTEVFVRSESVRVQVTDSNNFPVIDRFFGGNANLNVTISGNTGDAPTTGEYLTKVKWSALANGNYTISVYFSDYAGNDFPQFTKSFTVQD
jgi:hypothetical protein